MPLADFLWSVLEQHNTPPVFAIELKKLFLRVDLLLTQTHSRGVRKDQCKKQTNKKKIIIQQNKMKQPQNPPQQCACVDFLLCPKSAWRWWSIPCLPALKGALFLSQPHGQQWPCCPLLSWAAWGGDTQAEMPTSLYITSITSSINGGLLLMTALISSNTERGLQTLWAQNPPQVMKTFWFQKNLPGLVK